MLALGVVIVSRSGSFSGDLTRLLFGELLGVSWGDMTLQLIATLAIAAVAAICARPFMLMAFDPEQAQVAGFSSKKYHYLMMLLIAATIIFSFQTVGTLLVFGLLVTIPLVVVGSKLILRLIERFPLVIVAGGALLGWIAGELIASDPAAAQIMQGLPSWAHYAFSVAGAFLVVAVAKILEKRRQGRAASG